MNGFDPATEFLLAMPWPNLFEPARADERSDWQTFRCKGCGEIVRRPGRAKHYRSHTVAPLNARSASGKLGLRRSASSVSRKREPHELPREEGTLPLDKASVAPIAALRGPFVVLGACRSKFASIGIAIQRDGPRTCRLWLHPSDQATVEKRLDFVNDFELSKVDLPGAHAGLEIGHESKLFVSVNGSKTKPFDGPRHSFAQPLLRAEPRGRSATPEAYTQIADAYSSDSQKCDSHVSEHGNVSENDEPETA